MCFSLNSLTIYIHIKNKVLKYIHPNAIAGIFERLLLKYYYYINQNYIGSWKE